MFLKVIHHRQNPIVRNNLYYLGVDKRITLKWILKIVENRAHWIHLVQDKDQKRVIVFRTGCSHVGFVVDKLVLG
jgi:hypothetical protein